MLAILKRVLRAMGPVIITCIFLGAIWLLYREISKYSLADIRLSLERISTGKLLLSLALMVLNYAILVGYDWLALVGIGKKLSLSKVTLVSFVGQAVSYNFGALLGGSTVRFRFYSSWGFAPMEFVRLVLMLAITFWVGALGLVGAIFLIAPPVIPVELAHFLPTSDMRPLGAILFGIAMSYLVVCKFVHKPVHIFGKEFSFPPFKIAVAQAVVAGADLIAAGACLYVLLPDVTVSFIEFLPTYLMGMVAVVLSHVPGGAGVLEVVILHLTTADRQGVLAALLCFRVIYYLLPLLIAAVIFAIYEVRSQTRQSSGVLHDAGRWMRAFSPSIMGWAVFALGSFLCFFVVLPLNSTSVEALARFEPLGVLEVAHVLTALTAVLLLFLAPGLQHRQAMAYRFTLVTLACAMLGVFLSSMSWIMVLLIAMVFFCVWSIRRRCCRPSSVWKLHINAPWFVGALLIMGCSLGLGLIIHRSDPSDPTLWLAAGYAADTPRLMRTLGAEVLLLGYLLVGYWRTAPLRRKRH